LEKQYALRGLIPSDAYSLAAVNEADHIWGRTPQYDALEGFQWQVVLRRLRPLERWRRLVRVCRGGSGWDGRWWFAGLAVNSQASVTLHSVHLTFALARAFGKARSIFVMLQ